MVLGKVNGALFSYTLSSDLIVPATLRLSSMHSAVDGTPKAKTWRTGWFLVCLGFFVVAVGFFVWLVFIWVFLLLLFFKQRQHMFFYLPPKLAI